MVLINFRFDNHITYIQMSIIDTFKSWITWTWTYLWLLWFILVAFLFYILKGPLKIIENVSMIALFFNTLTPKFYVALTGTSSLISGLILIFEWWYFKKYGTSFIEQLSSNYITSTNSNDNNSDNNTNNANVAISNNSNGESNNSNNNSDSNFSLSDHQAVNINKNSINSSINNNNFNELDADESNQINTIGSRCSNSSVNNVNNNSIVNSTSITNNNSNTVPECKVWKNPMSLLRGAEYSRLVTANGKEPLTFYDMNLSAQDHQTFFTCLSDDGKPEFEIMQLAWRERNPQTRIKLAKEALIKNSE
jgi:hypothetical protein